MPFGAMFDTAIGLVFVWLLTSLFASAIQEGFEARLRMRAAYLFDGLARMLSAQPECERADAASAAGLPSASPQRVSPRQLGVAAQTSAVRLANNAAPKIAAQAQAAARLATTPTLFQQVWLHPLLAANDSSAASAGPRGIGLSQLLPRRGQGPTYLSSRTFALAVLDILSKGSQATAVQEINSSIAELPEGEAKAALRALWNAVGQDLDRFRIELERWYDDIMERVTGVYRRYVQGNLFLIGLVAAVLLNVDSMRVGETLWRDQPTRAAVAALAQACVSEGAENTLTPRACHDAGSARAAPAVTPPATAPPTGISVGATSTPPQSGAADRRARSIADMVTALPLPVGWPDSELQSASVHLPPGDFAPLSWWWALIRHVVGWLLTAMAVSLGANFWFDTLKKLMNLRSAGPPPPETDQARRRAAASS